MKLQLFYTRMALVDLDDIYGYIAADNPRRATSYIEEIRQACRALCDTPMIGVLRSDLRPGIRILPMWRRIIIVYELPEARVDVLRVFSGGRDYEAILGDSIGRS